MQPTPLQPASVEPYGGVPSMRRRDAGGEGSSANDHTLGPGAYATPIGYPQPRGAVSYSSTPIVSPTSAHALGLQANGVPEKRNYAHNGATACLIVPSLLSLVMLHPTPYPLIVLLFSTLLLYALDLSNSRDGAALGVWISFVAISLSLLSGIRREANMFGGNWAYVVTKTAGSVILIFTLACWATLQMKWLHIDTPSFVIAMERLLHSALPLSSAAVLTHCAVSVMGTQFNMEEAAATAAPLIFATILSLGIGTHATLTSSFRSSEDNSKEDGQQVKASDIPRAVTATDGWCLSLVLVVLPTLSHLTIFRHRLLHLYASWDDWLELLLTLTTPYMMHYFLLLIDTIWWNKHLPWILRTGKTLTLRGAFVPMTFSLVSSIAFQQRYIVPVSESVSFLFNGHETQPSVLTSVYLTLSTCSVVGAMWFFQRKDKNGELLGGEYHEDVMQLILAVCGASCALGFGLPLRLVPLPTLMLLGFAIYISTRMLRFFAVIMVTVFISVSFLVQYRFIYIPKTVKLVPMFDVTLAWFAFIISFVGLLVLTVVGLVLRSSDGFGAAYMRNIDLAGVLLCCYAIFLGIVEAILLKEPIALPSGEEGNQELSSNGVYEPYWAFVTGIILICISSHLKKAKCIKTGTAAIVTSICVGKMLVVTADINGMLDDTENSTWALILKELIASLLLVVIFAPYSFLEPIHVKARTKRSLGPSGKPVDTLSSIARRTVTVYCGIVLPMIIAVSLPTVIKQLLGLVRDGGAYYNTPPTLFELLGAGSSLWGLAVLSMLNHFLPDGGAEIWRKASALMFLLGLGILFAAPTLPGSSDLTTPSRVFATVSSLGDGVSSGKTGGWGLIAASLATLLALTGPLELKERRDSSGGKDKLLLLRLMLFSILFGCGVAWFIIIQFMGEESFVPLFLTSVSCMVMAFLGTVASALGYFIEVENFDDAQQIAKVWMLAFPAFLLLSGASMLSRAVSSPLSAGGCISTYLIVCGSCNLAFAAAVKHRSNKSPATRSIGNLSCFASWIFGIVVLYGQFGLASIGVPSGTLFGCPLSIFGTCVVSMVLLLLEGETSERSARTYSLSSQRKKVTSFGVKLTKLTKRNRFAPPVAGMVIILLASSLFVILLRGCWLLPDVFQSGGKLDMGVPKSHEDVFASIYGSNSRTTGVLGEEDVATMAQKNLAHSEVVVTAAKLAGSGFWTSQNIFGPLMHLGGALAVMPSLYCLLSQMWEGKKHPAARVMAMLPLNLIPLVLCAGIPSLRAVATLSLLGGILQVIFSRRDEHSAHMRI
uniref:Uncharacterized protein n=1 Tax=Odontella aurita TaxID=265563 RepID=A0A6U6IPV7_9STRA|mmetsp:Transcript_5266/g.15269  ORF Transcript_5266/g.15269 Transcript_5266/m.15269 type:complete len:1280 (+) Transcript_5266:107-3946(+)